MKNIDMKKFVFILGLCLVLGTRVYAETYHGIDVDAVYKISDWSSKEKIKEIIDDYTLLLKYQGKLILCNQSHEKIECMNKLAEKVIKHFYNGDIDGNLNNYHNYVISISEAYSTIYCLSKYKFPAGTMCNQENNVNTEKFIEQYLNEMLQSIEQNLRKYSFISNYQKDL